MTQDAVNSTVSMKKRDLTITCLSDNCSRIRVLEMSDLIFYTNLEFLDKKDLTAKSRTFLNLLSLLSA